MSHDLTELFDESIRLELNAARLYDFFRELFREDAIFWGQLAEEEKNHAALLQDGRDRFYPIGKFPVHILPSSITSIVWANRGIVTLLDKYRERHPTREEAFNTALSLEQSAGEVHYQEFMEKGSSSRVEEIFKDLNRNDKDHALRIRSYMEEHNIIIEK